MSILRSILPNDGDNAKEMLKNYARLRQSIHAFEQEEEKAKTIKPSMLKAKKF